MPTGGAIHRWYLDDGVFMDSVTEVEGVLTASSTPCSQWASSLTYVKRPCGARAWCLRLPSSRQRHACTWKEARRCWGRDPLGPLPIAGGGPPGCTEGQVRAAVAALADTQSAHALMRSCLKPAKVQYALRTLPIRHTAAFAADVAATQRSTWDAVVGTPTSDAVWLQTILQLSAGGCGVSSASDVAPVARLR